jgi:predicted nucleic-acid-binding Zn-ribbon protein
MELRCAKCGSERIVPLASILDQGQYSDGKLKARIYSNPQAWVFKGAVYARLQARICGDCGYTELIASNANELYEAYRQANPPSEEFA